MSELCMLYVTVVNIELSTGRAAPQNSTR